MAGAAFVNNMIDWLLDEPARAERAVLCIVIIFIAIGVWFGKKRLAVTLPLAFLFFVVAAAWIPSVDWGNRVSEKNNCINNLRHIYEAKAEWAQLNHKLTTDVPTETDLIGTNKFLFHSIPVCPSGGTYAIGAVNEDPKCSLAARGHKLP
jgi:hypothetical protein